MKLRTFWELESIGIKQEESSVLKTFKKTITLRNQRYEAGLPWKEAHDLLPNNCVIKYWLDKGIIKRVE